MKSFDARRQRAALTKDESSAVKRTAPVEDGLARPIVGGLAFGERRPSMGASTAGPSALSAGEADARPDAVPLQVRPDVCSGLDALRRHHDLCAPGGDHRSAIIRPSEADPSRLPNWTSGQGRVIQRTMWPGQAEYVQKTYAEELEKTDTAKAMADVVKYPDKYVFDVFTTDRVSDCESGDRVVVPSIEEATKAEAAREKNGGEGFYSDVDDRFNGLSIEDNCRIIAEHEFVHFWYQYPGVNFSGGLGRGDPVNWNEINRDNSVLDGLAALQKAINEEKDYDSTFDNEYDFLLERVAYALDPSKTGSTPAETPAVLQEMNSFLEKRLSALDSASVQQDLELVDRLRGIQKLVQELRDKFPRGPLPVQ